MDVTLSDVAAAYQIYKEVAAWLKKHPERMDREMRMALKELHFSDRTIGRIESILSASDERERERFAGEIAITQRDDRHNVDRSLGTLLQLSRDAGVSIPATRALRMIYYGKTNVRRGLANSLLNYSNEDQTQLDELLVKIRELNAVIEQLDSRLVGQSCLRGRDPYSHLSD